MVAKPYSSAFFAPRPSPATIFFRTCILWQLVRFAWINLKMVRMISKAHAGRIGPAAAPPPPVELPPAPGRTSPA